MAKQRLLLIGLPALAALLITAGVVLARGPSAPGDAPLAQTPVGAAFTYQGRLDFQGQPANGDFDFQFSLFNSSAGGGRVGNTVNLEDVAVTDGLFTVSLDFGSGVFTGDARWLEVEVRLGSETGDFTTLSPRQPLTPTPYALALPGLFTLSNDTSPNLIGGWSSNSVADGVVGATISGGGTADDAFGDPAPNQVTADYGTVGGGQGNTASGRRSSVSGGNHNTASGGASTVGGGLFNTASGGASTVGGGSVNTVGDTYATVGGGNDNIASGVAATVAGGNGNSATAHFTTIAGGGRSDPNNPATGNRVTDDYGTVGGGGNNQAGNADANTANATYATVGGGFGNTASGPYSTLSGGNRNTASGGVATVGGGEQNIASGSSASTVSGGARNEASGFAATVPGGWENTAGGEYSFSAGRNAEAIHNGAFVWADSTPANFSSSATNQFNVRASGGTRIFSNSTLSTGVTLAAGGNAWSGLSDRNTKNNFATVDGRDVLERLGQVTIETWNLKSQDPSIRHMGPMAQDFYAAFGLGEDDRHISTIDADGVALAAIQGLYGIVQEQEARIDALEARLEALEGSSEGSSEGNFPEAGLLSPGAPFPWLLLGAALLVGLVVGRRWYAGSQK